MNFPFSPAGALRERALLAACIAAVLIALLAPGFDGAGLHTHDFADRRGAWGIPCAADVLSNLPFALFGLWGLVRLVRWPDAGPPAARACAALFFGGLVLTAVGSSIYHAHPDDAGLLWDRGAMAVAFAGLLGLAACERVSARAGRGLAALALAGGLLAVAHWRTTGDVLPWGVLQFGGMLLVLVLATLRPVAGALGLRLGAVVLVYAAAKAFEMADVAVFEFTRGLMSGHTLKHLLASLAALPVLAAFAHGRASCVLRHNRRDNNDRRLAA
jgi:hypothetical protein